MVTIKNKGIGPKLPSPARAITSIIVPFREKNRPPQLAHQEFANRPITICLYPNYRCSIEELPAVALRLNKIWREITNHDIRYQQKRGNIPSFLGIRDLCVKTSYSGIRLERLTYNDLVNYDCYPYLRITLDSVRVATFIIRNWSARTAQIAHEYSVCEMVNGVLSSHTFDLYKSNPYYFEQLAKLKNIHSIAFGASAEYKNASASKLDAEAERQLKENESYREFVDTGGNEFQDLSRLRQSEADLNESIKSLNSVKQDTEKQQQLTLASQAYKNYVEASLANLNAELAKKDLSTYDQRYLWEKELHNLKAQAMRIAKQKDQNDIKIQELNIAYEKAMQYLDIDDDGSPTTWAYIKDFMNACGGAVGLGVGAFMGTNVKGIFKKTPKIGY